MVRLNLKPGRSTVPPARHVAFDVLLRVETESSFASELLSGPLLGGLDERDASLTTEIVLGTLRWQGMLDFIAKQHTLHWAKLDAEVRVALRMGLYQLWFLCRVPGRMPVRAALYETVEVVKASGKRSAAGLVNAVLRKSLELQETSAGARNSGVRSEKSERNASPSLALSSIVGSGTESTTGNGRDAGIEEIAMMRPPEMPEIDWLAIYYSHPAWMLERWIGQMGRERALEVASANNCHPATFLRISDRGPDGAGVERQLSAEGIAFGPGKILKSSRLLCRGNIVRTEMFRRGAVTIQDEASQAVPMLLDVREGHRVLDLCAAPGNKTRQLAEAAGANGKVVACDVHLHRLAKMAVLLTRTAETSGTKGVLKVLLDGERELPFSKYFDRVLVDAPCSGTGTLARHPEIKWRLQPGDIRSLADKQLRLLHSAAEALAPGGRMVYSVCSIEKEEGRQVARKFLESRKDFRLVELREDAERLRPLFLPEASRIFEGEFFTTDSACDGVDGFFAAVLMKSEL